MNIRNKAYAESINIMLSFLLSTTFLIGIGVTLYHFYHSHLPIQAIQFQFLDKYQSLVMPKPKENFVFIALLLLFPGIVFISTKLSLMTKKFIQRKYYMIMMKVIILGITGFVSYIFYNSEYIDDLTIKIFHHTFVNILLFLIGLCLFYTWQYPNLRRALSKKKIPNYLIIGLASLAILISIFSFRVASIYSIEDSYPWVVNFSPVFYSLSQILAGKKALIDFGAQYGMYGVLLAPIFKIVGLSILNFTLAMAILETLALLFLFKILFNFISNKTWLLLCIFSLCMLTSNVYLFANFENIGDPYYQYYPIRFFFPTLEIFLLFQMINLRKNLINYVVILSCISCLAIIWNIDSGIPSAGTFLIYLLSLVFFPSIELSRKKAICLLLLAISIILLFFVFFGMYLQFKAGDVSIHYSSIFKYQKLYYDAGFMMLPMPLEFNPWQVIVGIYVLGITGAMCCWLNGKRVNFWEISFCLSILGLGLFSYYQRRSHTACLIAASWPAIIIAFILTERLFRLIRLKLLPRIFSFLCLPIILFALWISADFTYSLPHFYQKGKENWKIMLRKEETNITRNLLFIKTCLQGVKETVIMAPNQSIYYGELALASSIPSTSLIEIILKKDEENLLTQLKLGRSKTMFIQLENGLVPEMYLKYLDKYKMVKVSKDDMAFLVLVNVLPIPTFTNERIG